MQEFGSEVAILYFRGFNSATFFVVVVAVVVFVVTSTGLAVCISATIFVVDVVVASIGHFRQHFRHHFCC